MATVGFKGLTKIKIAVTGCHILRLKCTQIDFFSAPDPAGGAYSAPPDPIAGFERSYTSKRGEGKEGRGGKGPTSNKGEGGGKGKEGNNGLTSKGGKGRKREER